MGQFHLRLPLCLMPALHQDPAMQKQGGGLGAVLLPCLVVIPGSGGPFAFRGFKVPGVNQGNWI
jgi:hypothetical protein